MLTCKQVSKSLAEQDYETLSWPRKLCLKIHVALCFVCGRYNRQMMDLHDGIRGYQAYQDAENPAPDSGLTEQQKNRMKEALHTGS